MLHRVRHAAAARLLLGSTGLGTLGTVLGAALGAVFHTGGIESAADDVITYTGKVFDTAAADEHDGVLLEVVALAGDVGVYFLAVGEAHTSHFTHGRVRFLRCRCVDADTDTAALGAAVESGALALILHSHASFAY